MAETTVVQSFLLFIFLAVGCFRGISAEKGRIAGGQLTNITAAPYIVHLRRYGSGVCGGTLISSCFVLTAAHCVYNHEPEEFEVFGGLTYLNNDGESRGVDQIHTHPSFNMSSPNMDVAVLRLVAPMIGPNIKSIPICSHPMSVGARTKVSGWGLTSEGGSHSHQLRSVEIPVISKESCEKNFYGIALPDNLLCAFARGKDACRGDSGGPMAYNNEVCGIISTGLGCARGYPGIYIDVYKMRWFIIDAVESSLKEHFVGCPRSLAT